MLLQSIQGTWLIPRVLAMPVFAGFSNIVITEVITGYADHQWRYSDFQGGTLSDNDLRIRRISNEFVDRFGSSEPIREIRLIGHSDRVWRHGGFDVRDEDDISQKRANEASGVLAKDIIMNPAGLFPAGQLQAEIETGFLKILVVGVGARRRLTANNNGAAPENRRVVIELSLTQSIPI
jgi:hypothetical protein